MAVFEFQKTNSLISEAFIQDIIHNFSPYLETFNPIIESRYKGTFLVIISHSGICVDYIPAIHENIDPETMHRYTKILHRRIYYIACTLAEKYNCTF